MPELGVEKTHYLIVISVFSTHSIRQIIIILIISIYMTLAVRTFLSTLYMSTHLILTIV